LRAETAQFGARTHAAGEVMLAFFNMLSPWHILLFLVVALLLFGNRLPEVARSLGKAVTEFKKGLRDVHKELDREDIDDVPPKRRLHPPAEEQNEPAAAEHPQEEKEAEPADSSKTGD
jgi:sec-independent protein translocase protein TatA